jgi:hypothetical protein
LCLDAVKPAAEGNIPKRDVFGERTSFPRNRRAEEESSNAQLGCPVHIGLDSQLASGTKAAP